MSSHPPQPDVLTISSLRHMLTSVLAALPARPHDTAEDRQIQSSAAVAALAELAPRDPIEAMLAARIVAAHHAAMGCFRRAAANGESDPADRRMYNAALSMSRMASDGLRALERHRNESLCATPDEAADAPVVEAPPAADNVVYLPTAAERRARKG